MIENNKDKVKGPSSNGIVTDIIVDKVSDNIQTGVSTIVIYDSQSQEIYDVYIQFSQEKTENVIDYDHDSFVYEENIIDKIINFMNPIDDFDPSYYVYVDGDVVHEIDMVTIDDEGYVKNTNFTYVVNEFTDAEGESKTGPVHSEIVVQISDLPLNHPANLNLGVNMEIEYENAAPNFQTDNN